MGCRCFLFVSPLRAKTLQSGQRGSRVKFFAWTWGTPQHEEMLGLHKTRNMFICLKGPCMPLLQLTTANTALEACTDNWRPLWVCAAFGERLQC